MTAKSLVTKEDLIKVGKKIGNVGAGGWSKMGGIPSLWIIVRHFGTWNSFMSACGCEVKVRKLKRKKRPAHELSRKSNEELVSYTEKKYRGQCISELQRNDRTLYAHLRSKGLIDDLTHKGIIIRRVRYYTDDSLIAKVKREFMGASIAELQRLDEQVYASLLRRNLLSLLVEDGTIKRVKKRRFSNIMPDTEILTYTELNFSGMYIEDVRNSDATLYTQLARRELVDTLVKKGILMRKVRKPFSSMSDSEMISDVRKYHYGKTPPEFYKSDNKLYGAIRKRGLFDGLLNEGILLKTTRTSSKEFFFIRDEIEKIIKEAGYFPTDDNLRDLHKRGLLNAISKFHNGLRIVKQRMGYGSPIPQELEAEFQANVESSEQALTVLKHFSDNEKDVADILMALNPERFRHNAYRILSLGQYLGKFRTSGGGIPHSPDEVLHDLEFIIDKNELARSVILRKAFQLFEQRYTKDPQGTLDELTEKTAQNEGALKRVYQEILNELKALATYKIPGAKNRLK